MHPSAFDLAEWEMIWLLPEGLQGASVVPWSFLLEWLGEAVVGDVSNCSQTFLLPVAIAVSSQHSAGWLQFYGLFCWYKQQPHTKWEHHACCWGDQKSQALKKKKKEKKRRVLLSCKLFCEFMDRSGFWKVKLTGWYGPDVLMCFLIEFSNKKSQTHTGGFIFPLNGNKSGAVALHQSHDGVSSIKMRFI